MLYHVFGPFLLHLKSDGVRRLSFKALLAFYIQGDSYNKENGCNITRHQLREVINAENYLAVQSKTPADDC